MRRIGYGLIGILLGIIIYILILQQLPVTAEVKTVLSDFSTHSSQEDYLEEDIYDEYWNEDYFDENENIEETQEENVSSEPFLEFGSYHVSVTDFKSYEAKEIVKYGKVNPMFYYIRQIITNNPEEGEELVLSENNNQKPAEQNNNNNKVEEIIQGENVYHLGFDLVEAKEEVAEVSKVLEDFRQYGKLPIDKEYYNITSGYGSRIDPFENVSAFHTGTDFANVGIEGTNVYSMVHGKVKSVVVDPDDKVGYGNYVIIEHNGYSTLYAHLQSIGNIKEGDTVFAGSVLGKVGNTGRSTGPHLHLEIRIGNVVVNPIPFINEFR